MAVRLVKGETSERSRECQQPWSLSHLERLVGKVPGMPEGPPAADGPRDVVVHWAPSGEGPRGPWSQRQVSEVH